MGDSLTEEDRRHTDMGDSLTEDKRHTDIGDSLTGSGQETC